MINEMVNQLSKMTTTSQAITSDILMLQFTIVNAFIIAILIQKTVSGSLLIQD
jgi:hypothetical protein